MEETRYGLRVEIPATYEQAVERATAALKVQGFGVLTTIDVQQTLKQKLDSGNIPKSAAPHSRMKTPDSGGR